MSSAETTIVWLWSSCKKNWQRRRKVPQIFVVCAAGVLQCGADGMVMEQLQEELATQTQGYHE